MTAHTTAHVTAIATHLRIVLRRADDALVLGHRLSEWCGHAPTMEEDMALANMGLDLIGQARALYTHAGLIEDAGRDEDAFAYRRLERDYQNLLLVEQPCGDFAFTMLRQFLYAAFALPYWQATTRSTDATLAAIAARSEKEMAYHLRHAGEWVLRLGDGTPESHARLAEALDTLWPFTGELFAADADETAMVAAGIAADPQALRVAWHDTVRATLAAATLAMPADGWMQTGGRQGRHGEAFGHLLTELQFVQRLVPEANW